MRGPEVGPQSEALLRPFPCPLVPQIVFFELALEVLRGCLWLFGEYCEDEALIENVIQGVLAAVRRSLRAMCAS